MGGGRRHGGLPQGAPADCGGSAGCCPAAGDTFAKPGQLRQVSYTGIVGG